MNTFGLKPVLSFQLPLLVICAIAGLSRGWRGFLDERKIRHGVPIEDKYARNRTTRDASEYKNIRIAVFYDDSMKLLGRKEHGRIVDDHVQNAVKYVEKLLKIKRAKGSILIRRDCGYYESTKIVDASHSYCGSYCNKVSKCGDAVVPKQHLMQCHWCVPNDGNRLTCGRSGPKDGRGVNADFILYVTAKTYDCNRGDIAYASHCQTEKSLDRPVAGHMNICPDYAKEQGNKASMLQTLKRELLHALGFSANLFAFFRKKNGEPLTPRNEFNLPENNAIFNRGMYMWSNDTVTPVRRTNWWVASGPINKTVYMMVTPNVKREVRKHFNCKSLEGAEMESQAHQLSHWEKRVFDNEAMTATDAPKSVISRITLALLEDSGWYKVNYAMADPLLYGKGLGCDFVKKSCGSWINSRKAKKQSIAPFCDRVEEKGCTASTNEPGLCSVKKQPNVPLNFQNYQKLPGVPDAETRNYGGYAYSDYCGLYVRPERTDKEALRKISSIKCN